MTPLDIEDAVDRLETAPELTEVHDTQYEHVYWLTFEVASERVALMVEVGDARVGAIEAPMGDLIDGAGGADR